MSLPLRHPPISGCLTLSRIPTESRSSSGLSVFPLSPAISYYLNHDGGMKWGMGIGLPPLRSRAGGDRTMARTGKLSAVEVAKAKGPAVLHDGGGLYLRVSATGAKSWVFRFQLDGKRRDMGLGPFPISRSRRRAGRRQSTGSNAMRE